MNSIELPISHRIIAPPQSPLRLAADRFLANRLAVVGLIGLCFFVLACYGSLPWTLHTSLCCSS